MTRDELYDKLLDIGFLCLEDLDPSIKDLLTFDGLPHYEVNAVKKNLFVLLFPETVAETARKEGYKASYMQRGWCIIDVPSGQENYIRDFGVTLYSVSSDAGAREAKLEEDHVFDSYKNLIKYLTE